MSRCRWNLLPPVPEGHALKGARLHPFLARLAYHRGITTQAQLEAFLTGESRLLADPFRLPGMGVAVGRIYRALLGGERIAVYGDYDVDGVTATALLVQGLSGLGADAVPYIPHRLTEGYGLSVAGLRKLRAQGISLVITVDCGITSLREVKVARRLGLDVIVTDHHTPLAELPPAMAIINPRLAASDYPYPDLAGVGVSLKVVQALLSILGRDPDISAYVDLAALGTIADISPLTGENRYLVKEGLRVMKARPRPGLSEIMSLSGIGEIDTEKVSWIVAPCLNAAGRLEHAMTSYTLLTTPSLEEARRLAAWLHDKNAERQRMTTEAQSRAREQVAARGVGLLVMSGDREGHAGISGLVAGRLAEEFYRPAVVVKIGDRLSSGSCRSIPEFNIIAALNECRDLLARFGGHSQAAGFSCLTRNLPELERRLTELAAKQLEGADLRPQIDIDAEVRLSQLTGEIFKMAQQMAPFGCGNPAPVFMSRGVTVLDSHTMGHSGEHVKLKLKQGNVVWDGVGFRIGERAAEIASPLDIVYNIEVDRWNGAERLRLNLLDFEGNIAHIPGNVS